MNINEMSQKDCCIPGGQNQPVAEDVERAVLGALLVDEIALGYVVEKLREEYFYLNEHRVIFRAVKALDDDCKPVDILTVVDRLKKDGLLEAAGGAVAVAGLTNEVVSGAHVEYHARLLMQAYVRRQLIHIANSVVDEACDDTTDEIGLLDKTDRSLGELYDDVVKPDFVKIGDQLRDAGQFPMGVPTGFVELDRITGGMRPGALSVVAARPGMGKTAFVLSVARNVAVRFNMPVAIFSRSETSCDVAWRLLRMDDGETGEKLREAPIYECCTPELSMNELTAMSRSLKLRYNIRLVVIDEIDLVKAENEQEMSVVARKLKALSKMLRVSILVVGELNHNVEHRGGAMVPSMLSDLKEPVLEYEADLVMMLYRPDYYGDEVDGVGDVGGVADVIVRKNRYGQMGKVRMRFDKDRLRYYDWV